MRAAWVAMVVGWCALVAPCRAEEDPVNIVKSTDYDGAITYAVKTSAELKVMQVEANEDAKHFPAALSEAQRVWAGDPEYATVPYPKGLFRARKVAKMGVTVPDRSKAEAKVLSLQEKEAAPGTPAWNASEAEYAKARTASDALDVLRKAVKEVRAVAEAKEAEARAVAAATRAAAGGGATDPAAGAASGARVLLDDLRPIATEWGTEPHGQFPDMASGPMVCDWMSNGNSSPNFWPNNIKIISKANMAKSPIPEGQTYSSTMTNCFVVAGEYAAGVGLWARRMTFYHWLEYTVPAKATIFTADIFVTDDAMGFAWWHPIGNQQFVMQVLVDDVEVKRIDRTRYGLQPGAGELLETVTVPLPPGAKRIRFRVSNSGWGDGNCNTELVISNGAFIL